MTSNNTEKTRGERRDVLGVAGYFDFWGISAASVSIQNNFLRSSKIPGGFNLTCKERAFFELRTLKPFLC